MGLGNVFLSDLISLKRGGALDGAVGVAEIGAQQLSDTFLISPELDELYRLFARPRVALGVPVGEDCFTDDAPRSCAFWASLGLRHMAIDLVGEAVRIDLNCGTVPWKHRGKYDLVINAGTTEHIANQDNAFRAIHDLAATSGVMYHEVPAFMMNHGLFNYCPRFFHHLARENRYEVIFLRTDFHPEVPVSDGPPMPQIAIRAAFRKLTLAPFVTPLDMP